MMLTNADTTTCFRDLFKGKLPMMMMMMMMYDDNDVFAVLLYTEYPFYSNFEEIFDELENLFYLTIYKCM